jgi:hypothetical protein
MHREDLHPHMYGLLHEYPNEISSWEEVYRALV